jgi:fatty-acyl-CoA synthase
MRGQLTYSGLIVEALSRYPDREAFVHRARRVSYREAADLVTRMAVLLDSLGAGPGHGVALLSPNSPEAWFTQAATYLLGAPFTGIPVLSSFDDRRFICDDAEVAVLVAAETHADDARDLAAQCESIEQIVTLPTGGGVEDPASVGRAVATGAGPAAEEDVALLQYTGGTSGVPKGVMLPHRAMVQQTLSLLASWGLPDRPRYLAAGPISHAAMLPIVPTLLRGGAVVLMDSFDPVHWMRLIEQERINFTFAVPTMLYSVLAEKPEDRDLSALDTLTYGGAPMDPSRLAEAIERIGPVFHQVYGQTEVIGTGTALRRDEHDLRHPGILSSCGRAVVGAQVAVLTDDETPVRTGEVGELCVHTRAAMLGYRNRPEDTAAVLRDGWVRTGDLAYQDARGFFYLVDRKKDMIISGGINIYSREVEDVLGRHPAVAAVAVIGVPHAKWGEAVCAVVVRCAGQDVGADELIDFVRQRKGSLYSPKTVVFTEALPLTGTGKIDKKLLREPYWDARNRSIN